MPTERFRLAAAVYGIVIDGDDRILLMRRAGSGYRDGQLSLPAGHLDGGEDAVTRLVRELSEELKIFADPVSCRLAVTMHRVVTVALCEPVAAMSDCLDSVRGTLSGVDDEGIVQALRDMESLSRQTHAVMLELVAEADSRGIAAGQGFASTQRLLAGML